MTEYDLAEVAFVDIVLDIPREDVAVNIFRMEMSPDDHNFMPYDGLDIIAMVLKPHAVDEFLQTCDANEVLVDELDRDATLNELLAVSHERAWMTPAEGCWVAISMGGLGQKVFSFYE